MRKDKGMRGGVIVNIASRAALGAPFAAPVYAGTKHAVLGFTRSLKVNFFLVANQILEVYGAINKGK